MRFTPKEQKVLTQALRDTLVDIEYDIRTMKEFDRDPAASALRKISPGSYKQLRGYVKENRGRGWK